MAKKVSWMSNKYLNKRLFLYNIIILGTSVLNLSKTPEDICTILKHL